MAEIIFGYKMSPAFICYGVTEGYKFFVYEKGTVRLKRFVIEHNEKVIESKKMIIPLSVAEEVKKILIEQKNFIDKLPEYIHNNSLDGAYQHFCFIGKKISCWNICRHDLNEISDAKIFIGENSCFLPPSTKIIMQQENDVLKIFESVYKILKDYGLKVFSWEGFHCDWEMK